MTVFLFALAGIPPLGGWFAKFQVFRAVLGTGDVSGARARRGRRRELGDRALLLRQPRPHHVHGGRARRRRHSDQGPRRRSPRRSASPWSPPS